MFFKGDNITYIRTEFQLIEHFYKLFISIVL